MLVISVSSSFPSPSPTVTEMNTRSEQKKVDGQVKDNPLDSSPDNVTLTENVSIRPPSADAPSEAANFAAIVDGKLAKLMEQFAASTATNQQTLQVNLEDLSAKLSINNDINEKDIVANNLKHNALMAKYDQSSESTKSEIDGIKAHRASLETKVVKLFETKIRPSLKRLLFSPMSKTTEYGN